jgi:glycosyltransferase involved in cell wall biosynthesis
MRHTYGVRDDEFAIVTISRISREKRIELIIETAKILPQKYRFIIVGPCYDAAYGKEISQLSEGVQNFAIHDPVDNPGDVLNGADLFLLTSEYEGFALAMGEAIMLGVPVVSTQVGILEDLGFLARTVAPETATAQCFADHIVADLSDEKGRTDRAREARSIIHKKYSADQFADQWQSLIDSLIDVS